MASFIRAVVVEATNEGDSSPLARSFRRSLLAENKSPCTIQMYSEALSQFDRHLAGRGMPRLVAHIRREYIEDFVASLLARFKPATASNRFKSLKQGGSWMRARSKNRTCERGAG